MACYVAPGMTPLMRIALLSNILRAFNPTYNFDPKAILAQAACFACYGPGDWTLMKLQLLCEILANLNQCQNLIPTGVSYNVTHNYTLSGLTVGGTYTITPGANEHGAIVNGLQNFAPSPGVPITFVATFGSLVFTGGDPGNLVTARVCASDPVLNPDIVSWLKADAGVFSDAAGTVPANNGDVVKFWKNQSQFLQNATGSTKPTYSTNQLNGKPVLKFLGASSALFTTYTYPAFFTQPATFIFVARMDGGTHNQAPLSWNNLQVSGVGRRSTGAAALFESAGVLFSGGAWPTGQFVIVTAVINGASSFIRINQVQQCAGTSANISQQVAFSNNPGNVGETCQFAEIIAYKAALSAAQITLIEQYLKAKYAL